MFGTQSNFLITIQVNILQPGVGVGGHCIAVDPWFIVCNKRNAKLIKQARLINDNKPLWVVNKILKEVMLFKKWIKMYGSMFRIDI